METLLLMITKILWFVQVKQVIDKILDSNSINNYAEEEEETDKEWNDSSPVKLKFSEIAHAVGIFECWSLLDNSDSKIRQSLSLIS